jgi:hypothetical protein
MECLAAAWTMEAQYDPLATPEGPVSLSAKPATSPTRAAGAGPSNGASPAAVKQPGKRGRKAKVAEEEAMAVEAVQPVAQIPEKGCCPACQAPHT